MFSLTGFHDRIEGGRALAGALSAYRGKNVLVLGIPRGGVPVAAEVARELGADLDIVVARKLGAPGQPELAIGAVTANGGRYLNEAYIRELGVSQRYLEQETARKSTEAKDREARLRGRRPAATIEGRTVIVVDDGLATGATMRAALRSVRQRAPARLVMAAPVGAPESCAAMLAEADEVVCPLQPSIFYAVGVHYEEFEPVEDEVVARILETFRTMTSPGRGDSPRSIEIDFKNSVGYRLAGTLTVPPTSEPVPVVAFAHGMGSGRTSSRNRAIAERLVRSSIAAFMLDFTGHGDSQGAIEEASIERMAQDLAAALDVLKQREEVDAARIGVSGSSSGGVVALVLAAGDPRVKALVLRSVPAGGLESVASNVHAPTLVIAGSEDWPIVREDEALATLIPAEHDFVVVPGAGHLFEGPGQAERVAELTADWFIAKLGLPGTGGPISAHASASEAADASR